MLWPVRQELVQTDPDSVRAVSKESPLGTYQSLRCSQRVYGKCEAASAAMAWLIGAIVTYGIVVLLIGIAVMVYLLGGENRVAAEATRDDPALRRWPDRQIAPANVRQGAAAGTRTFAMR